MYGVQGRDILRLLACEPFSKETQNVASLHLVYQLKSCSLLVVCMLNQ